MRTIARVLRRIATSFFHTAAKPPGLAIARPRALNRPQAIPKEHPMGINDQRDIEANLQIGPTDQGEVRLFIEGKGIEIPMDFLPEEAEEIAEEILAAAKAARMVKRR